MRAFDKPPPAEIIGQMARGDTMEPTHPFLESAAVGVDVLNMVDPSDYADTPSQIHRAMHNAQLPCRRAQRATAIRT